MRKSGLQSDIFSLYRQLLRAAKAKEAPTQTMELSNFIKHEFRDRAFSIGRTDFRLIEHYLRHGHKQLKLLKMPGFSYASSIRKPQTWIVVEYTRANRFFYYMNIRPLIGGIAMWCDDDQNVSSRSSSGTALTGVIEYPRRTSGYITFDHSCWFGFGYKYDYDKSCSKSSVLFLRKRAL